MTAVRLLKEDFNETVNDHRTNNTQQVDSAMEWQEVTRGRIRILFNEDNNSNSNTGDQNRNRNQQARSDGNAMQNKEKVLIVGDSMTKFIKPNTLSKKHHVQSYSFAGAKVEDMYDFVKPLYHRTLILIVKIQKIL